MKLKISKLKLLFICCISILVIIMFLVVFINVFNFNYYKKAVYKCADNLKIDRSAVFAIIKVESNFVSNAVSNKGASGLMQIQPSTFNYMIEMHNLETEFDIFNAENNILIGCLYFKYLLDKFNDFDVAVCAYNAGEGNVLSWLNDKNFSFDQKTLYDVPFKETKVYLKKIKFYQKYYKRFDL